MIIGENLDRECPIKLVSQAIDSSLENNSLVKNQQEVLTTAIVAKTI